jgi:uncharacterized protein (DUF1800 family)
VTAIGPQAYIDEQVNVNGISDPIDTYVSQKTNGVPYIPQTNWLYTSVTGSFSSSNLYIYLDGVGEAYIDDVQLYALDGTGQPFGPNYIINGDFESPFPGIWQVGANLTNSSASSSVKCSGNFGLHIVSTSPGTTRASAISQFFPLDVASVTNKAPCQLSYRYLQDSNSHQLIVRLSGSGVVDQGGDDPALTPPEWIYVTQTGPASTGKLYVYLGGADQAYIDDINFVAGSTPEAGLNLVQNGDFESVFPGAWNVSTNLTNSVISTAISHSGAASLHIISSATGTTQGSSIWQDNMPVVTNNTYTLSYWYLPAGRATPLTVRLSGSGITTTDGTSTTPKYKLDHAKATIGDLRNWHCVHAVTAKAQLLEILDQFIENHFVTQWSKTRDFFDNIYNNNTIDDPLGANMEYRENAKWRAALLNPQCTFYDLLKISAESPAMIIYLDTVASKGNGANIANENFARELLELFTCGVDNGYDQNDIVQLSRAWTGWSVDLVDAPNLNNPLAPISVTFAPGVSSGARSNLVGVWTFHYNAGDHSGTNKYLFFNQTTNGNQIVLSPKHVPARFGPPWAGRDYSLILTNNSGTNGITDGYRAIAHLANLPFTEEYLSVKLCRLFVHDDFPNPTTKTDNPLEYGFYDYTDPNRSTEAELVHQCMLAWENSAPKGQIRAVLNTIFNSELFRSHGGSLQKVKTPLEFTASAVRALRAAKPDGTFTANVDGGSFSAPLSRMGTMLLFDRAAPDGYPETASPWISSGTLAERIRFVQSLCIAIGQNGHSGSLNDAGNNSCDPVGLLKLKLPAASWNNAGAVADYFLGILYPGEGKANLDQLRSLAIGFLDTDDTGLYNPPSTSFNTLVNTGTPYDTRVRGMVGMLLTLPRFDEQ